MAKKTVNAWGVLKKAPYYFTERSDVTLGVLEVQGYVIIGLLIMNILLHIRR